jgi:hypothetical protein
MRRFGLDNCSKKLTSLVGILKGASMLSRFYKSSIQLAIPSVFPEHRWETFKFERPSAKVSDD